MLHVTAIILTDVSLVISTYKLTKWFTASPEPDPIAEEHLRLFREHINSVHSCNNHINNAQHFLDVTNSTSNVVAKVFGPKRNFVRVSW